MRHPDHFLINEAWMKAERFERAVQTERLLNLYRASRTNPWRHYAARLLQKVATRLDLSLTPAKQQVRARPDGC